MRVFISPLLLNLFVTQLAIGTDRSPILRGMRFVVTPETTVRRRVALVVGVAPEGDLHRREHVTAIHLLNARHAAGDGLGITGAGLRCVEISETLVDRTQRGI